MGYNVAANIHQRIQQWTRKLNNFFAINLARWRNSARFATPQVGLSESTKMQFWKDLDSMVSTVPTSEKLFIGGDRNAMLYSRPTNRD